MPFAVPRWSKHANSTTDGKSGGRRRRPVPGARAPPRRAPRGTPRRRETESTSICRFCTKLVGSSTTTHPARFPRWRRTTLGSLRTLHTPAALAPNHGDSAKRTNGSVVRNSCVVLEQHKRFPAKIFSPIYFEQGTSLRNPNIGRCNGLFQFQIPAARKKLMGGSAAFGGGSPRRGPACAPYRVPPTGGRTAAAGWRSGAGSAVDATSGWRRAQGARSYAVPPGDTRRLGCAIICRKCAILVGSCAMDPPARLPRWRRTLFESLRTLQAPAAPGAEPRRSAKRTNGSVVGNSCVVLEQHKRFPAKIFSPIHFESGSVAQPVEVAVW